MKIQFRNRPHTALLGAASVALMVSFSPAHANPIIFDNGVVAPNRGLSSQIDTVYPFESAVADNFMLGDVNGTGMDWDVTAAGFTGLQFNTPPDIPNPANFQVSFYADNGAGTAPMYTGNGTTPPGGDALAIFSGLLTAPESAPGPYSYIFDFGGSVALDVNTTYWMSVQAVEFFPPQWGWRGNNNGGNAVQGFPLLGTLFWTTVSPGTEMDFQLFGSQQTGGGQMPVPGSGLLILAGLLGLGLQRRWRS